MSFNLLDAVKGYVTPELVSSASAMLGENPAGISKALEAAVPSLLQGVVSKGGSDSSGLLDLAKQAAGSGVMDNLGGLLGGNNSNLLNMGTGILSSLFGSKTSMLSNLIASFAGIKPSSTSSLLSSLAPLALGVIGKQALSSGLDAKGLSSLLSSQKDSVAKSIPAGLNLSSIFDEPKRVHATVKEAYSVPEKKAGLPAWLLPLLLVVLGGLLLWYLLGRKDEVKVETPALVQPDTAVTVPAVVSAVRESLKVELPNGTTLDAYKGGIEDQLVSFLKDPNAAAGKDVWFDFDNLNFNVGTAEITSESQKQVDNIAAILKAFPKAKIKIGGYTDKTGDDASNMKLSADRANAVKNALNKAGVGAQATEAEGYGSTLAKAAADAPESEKLKDRRVSVSVRAK